jgi:hypothetical protein
LPVHEHTGTPLHRGYLGDIGVPPPHDPMDFSAWFEAYLDGAWHVLIHATIRQGSVAC